MARKVHNLVQLQGVIAPADWDEDGGVIAIKLATLDEQEYSIDDNPMSGDFFGLLHAHVRVTGTVTQTASAELMVTVQDYEIVED